MTNAAPPRWKRPAEFLVYLVPVGGIPSDLFTSYARLLQTHSELPLRSLTRPGGYAAELSPFRGLDWTGKGSLRFHFVSTAEHVESCDGEDVHVSRRVIGALGVCHSLSLTLSGGLQAAHAQFEASVRRFPALLMHKLFAFEHTFEVATSSECEGLNDLVMFPVHHELEGTGESTVTLHLQVVMDTLAVNILMALESAIRSATSSAAASGIIKGGDLASVLLDVNVEPQQTQTIQHSVSSPLVLSRDTTTFSSASSPSSRSSNSSFSSIPPPLAAGVSAFDPRNRRRKRHLARREKLLGDYSVLASCISDAMDHYIVAIEMLREEERRSGGASGDALWLAAALEGYVFCLYTDVQSRFSAELVEKASEAVAFYAKAGTTELESLLIENLGWYYVDVATSTLTRTSMTGEAKLSESVWIKRLLWDVLERGLMLFPELQPQRQVEFLIQTSRMLETVGHRRRVALFLHEAASLLLARNAPNVDAQLKLLLSPSSVTKGPQRQRDLEAALFLERAAAERLGILDRRDELPWEVTTQYRRNRRKESFNSTTTLDNSWLIIRFHVLRQLLTIARMLGDALLVGKYCLELLEMLVWCDSIASVDPSQSSPLLVDHLQHPATSLRVAHPPIERTAAGLHARSSVYSSPPPGIDTRVRRNFINSPSTTMSNAAASLQLTLTNTPRILATPRQQFSAAVNAISTKASPAFTPFSHAHHQLNGALTSRASGTEDRTQHDGKEFGVNGDGGSKSSRALGRNEGETDAAGAVTAAGLVWNLRSRAEIAMVERNLLKILEAVCTALRPSEQTKLPTFLHVDKLKLRSSCNSQHPFFPRETALEMFGVQSASGQLSVKSDFFYSPFEKKKMKRKTGDSGEEDDSEDAPAMYERGFPVHERIELQLTLSNPTGVAVKLQEVKAWVTFAENDHSTSTATKDGYIECYPCFFTLEPYQKRKTVVLGLQPLKVGTFHVRGCFIKALNIQTSFYLRDPVNVRVVGELPVVSLSLREHGTMALLDGKRAAAELATSKMQMAILASETRRCMLRARSTGNRPITNYRLAVTLQHRRAEKKTCVVFNNLPSTTDGSSVNGRAGASPIGKIETKALALRCGKVVSSPLPLTSGDFVSIPFDVSLYGQQEAMDEDIQIEWSFVYADETGTSVDAVFYREAKLTLQLLPLPSLMLQAVAVLPCSSEHFPKCRIEGGNAEAVTTDHLYCAVLVQVVNPTETTFRFRLRRDLDDSGDAICEAEIGRQCSRRFVVEAPRLQAFPCLVDVLNDLLEMEWETYFGTRGRLLCEGVHVGSSAEQEQMTLELLIPPISFKVQSPLEEVASAVAREEQNGGVSKPKHGRYRSLSLHPLSFFQMTHLTVGHRVLETKLFQYVPITVTIQRAEITGEQSVSGVEVEVRVTEEDDGFENSDQVMVVGLLKTHVRWDDPTDRSAKFHEVQCVFLSEGNFCVAVCGRVLDQDVKPIGGAVWAHQPMHVRVRSDDAEKTTSTIY
ncbi:Transport protein Trs120 or TRAPPC9/TRAPP II complex subunit [Phytophthora infestans]|uniref:Transport protein Trs120 or TRAPPC9/TRAPP II complex subunit n=1 Tax=Phytophthora infestans TaxID=4787 RepID=A0A833SJN8_PHYIN|nr:Transport protein Trs120 or TRAPPC9/TRAPP II complex subunit [Phytophthora infestans]